LLLTNVAPPLRECSSCEYACVSPLATKPINKLSSYRWPVGGRVAGGGKCVIVMARRCHVSIIDELIDQVYVCVCVCVYLCLYCCVIAQVCICQWPRQLHHLQHSGRGFRATAVRRSQRVAGGLSVCPSVPCLHVCSRSLLLRLWLAYCLFMKPMLYGSVIPTGQCGHGHRKWPKLQEHSLGGSTIDSALSMCIMSICHAGVVRQRRLHALS